MSYNGEDMVGDDGFGTTEHYIKELEGLIRDAKRLCDIIVDSVPETTIKGEIESCALLFLHHPTVMRIS